MVLIIFTVELFSGCYASENILSTSWTHPKSSNFVCCYQAKAS